jgi:hypothetical protein
LERARRKNAAQLLNESRSALKEENRTDQAEIPAAAPAPAPVPDEEKDHTTSFSQSLPLSSISPPPPISEVLQDIYNEENTTSH